MTSAHIVSVNLAVVRTGAWTGDMGRTGIDKRPTTERVKAHRLGIEGDSVVDTRHHGGVEQAVSEPLQVLHRIFGYDAFRGEQQAVIDHVTGGGDALVLMPTGAGKSLCYQIPALVRPGVGVVVSPLIAPKQEPRRQLIDLLRTEHAGHSGIVYCLSRASVEKVAGYLVEQGIDALPYHAGLDAGTRAAHQARFLREDRAVMVATIAFGMGIDKPDVRFVAHLDLPKSVEGYYQETGRAGRDGLPATAWLAYGLADVVQQRRMIDDSDGDLAHRRRLVAHLDAMLALTETAGC